MNATVTHVHGAAMQPVNNRPRKHGQPQTAKEQPMTREIVREHLQGIYSELCNSLDNYNIVLGQRKEGTALSAELGQLFCIEAVAYLLRKV